MSENSLPSLTICVPTFSRAMMLDKCLEALYDIQLNGHDFCLMVADNGSPDNTKEVIAKWMPKFARMEAIFHDTNLGSDRNFYSLYEAVKTEYCWMLGDCDSISIEHFTKIEANLGKGYDAIVINTMVSMLSINSKVYTDIVEFLDEQFWHITKNSSFILTRKAIKPDLLQRYFDSNFIHVGAFIEYLSLTKKFEVYYDKDIHLIYMGDDNYKENITKGWRQIPFHVWAKCYSTMILSFPQAIPYELKLKLMKDHERHFHWFAIRNLMVNKIYRGKSYVDSYRQNRKFVHMVSVASPFLSDFVMYMPIDPFYKVVRFLKIFRVLDLIKNMFKRK